jgi:hypothetical protein
VCPKYDVELGRAWEKQRLNGRSLADAELTAHGSPRPANSDAVAMATFLQAIGLRLDADRVNKLLALLAVLCIECGGGLSLAVGMALGDKEMSGQAVHRGVLTPACRRSLECPPLLQKYAMCALCTARNQRHERGYSTWCATPRGSCALVTEPLPKPLA